MWQVVGLDGRYRRRARSRFKRRREASLPVSPVQGGQSPGPHGTGWYWSAGELSAKTASAAPPAAPPTAAITSPMRSMIRRLWLIIATLLAGADADSVPALDKRNSGQKRCRRLAGRALCRMTEGGSPDSHHVSKHQPRRPSPPRSTGRRADL
jgi:hypothetical protein